MLKKFAAGALLATLSLSSYAAPAESVANPSTPFYAGVDLGQTHVDDLGHANSFGGFVGYAFNANFSAEAGIRRLGKFAIEDGKKTINEYALTVVGTLPLTKQFSVFGRLGQDYVSSKTRTSDFSENFHNGHILYGVGVSYDLGDSWSARLEVQKPARQLNNLNVGLKYSF